MRGVRSVYYIEQICTPNQIVRVTIHPEEITRPLSTGSTKRPHRATR